MENGNWRDILKTPFDFKGYRVMVAGGSRGIGRAVVLGFLDAGARVAACARGEDGLRAVRGDASENAASLYTQRCNLAQADEIKSWIAAAARELGGIDVLVNCATGYGFHEQDADWEMDFKVDLMAAVRASREALPYLKQSSHGSILHTSSIGALRPRVMGPPYAAMKAALSHYTTTQALMLAEYGIRVNAVAPGSIEFPGGVWRQLKSEKPEQYAKILATIPFGRYGTPEEVAQVALFLASPLAGWITGQIIVVDGGQSLRF